MNILNCNVRDASRKGFIRKVNGFLVRHNPDIIILMEIMVNSIELIRSSEESIYQNFIESPPKRYS